MFHKKRILEHFCEFWIQNSKFHNFYFKRLCIKKKNRQASNRRVYHPGLPMVIAAKKQDLIKCSDSIITSSKGWVVSTCSVIIE
jgi:hypothetical protein